MLLLLDCARREASNGRWPFPERQLRLFNGHCRPASSSVVVLTCILAERLANSQDQSTSQQRPRPGLYPDPLFAFHWCVSAVSAYKGVRLLTSDETQHRYVVLEPDNKYLFGGRGHKPRRLRSATLCGLGPKLPRSPGSTSSPGRLCHSCKGITSRSLDRTFICIFDFCFLAIAGFKRVDDTVAVSIARFVSCSEDGVHAAVMGFDASHGSAGLDTDQRVYVQ